MKIVNDALTASYRRRGPCRWCGRKAHLCGAHVYAKGHGGGRQIDLPCNLVSLGFNAVRDCECHALSHNGHEPTFEQMVAISAADHDCLQGDIEALIRLIQRMPKFSEMTVERWTGTVNTELNFGARRLAMRELESFRHLLTKGD